MSDVEQLFTRLQEKTGGTMKWHDLHPQYQQIFIQSINNILQICSLKGE